MLLLEAAIFFAESRGNVSESRYVYNIYVVQRKPYTVGNKTVFLSDEELEVFKMTMGKEHAKDLVPVIYSMYIYEYIMYM
jgi:hypothetical protein